MNAMTAPSLGRRTLLPLGVLAVCLLGGSMSAAATPITRSELPTPESACALSVHFKNSGNPTYDQQHFGDYRQAIEAVVTASNDIDQAFYTRVAGPGVKEPLYSLCLVIGNPSSAQSVKQRLLQATANMQGGLIKP